MALNEERDRNPEQNTRDSHIQPDNGIANRSKVKDWSIIIGSIVAVLGSLALGVNWMVSSALDPLVVKLQQMDARAQEIHTELKTVRVDIVDLRERMIRVETLLAQPPSKGSGQRTSDSPTSILKLTSARLPCHP